MRITKLSDRAIELLAKKALAKIWIQEEGRHQEADLADPDLNEHFALVDLHLSVIHPWLVDLAAVPLGLTAAELREVLQGGLAGWAGDGTFLTGSEAADVYPLARGPIAVAARLAGRDFVIRKLPVLPRRVRADFPGIDRLYQTVIHQAFVARSYGDAPSILTEHQAIHLQQAVDQLFDNRITMAPMADLEGRALPSLSDVVDAARGSDAALAVAMQGAALSIQP